METPEPLAPLPRQQPRAAASSGREFRFPQLVQTAAGALAAAGIPGAVALFVEAGRELVFVGSAGGASAGQPRPPSRHEPSPITQAWRSGESVAAGGLVALPLVFDGRVIGVAAVSRENAPFSEPELATLRAVAPVLAHAVQSGQMFEEERRNARVLAQLRRSLLPLGACEDVASFLRIAARGVRQVSGAAVGGIGLVTEDGFGPWAAATEEGELSAGSPPVSLLALGVGGAASSFASNSPWLHVLPTGHPPVEQVVAAPMLVNGETVGVVYAAAAPGCELEGGVVHTVQLFADHATTAWRFIAPREAVSRELSEKSRTLAGLRRSELLHDKAQEVAGLGSWSWDLATDRIECSAGLLLLLERRRESAPMELESLLAVVHPADRAQLSEAIMRAVSQEQDGRFSLEHRILCGESSVRHVRSAGMVTVEKGRPTLVLGTMLDVTAHAEALASVRDAAETSRLMLEQAPIATSLVDIHGRIERVNSALASMLGYTPEELVGRHISELTHPDDQRGDAEVVGALLAGLTHQLRREKRYIRKDGGVLHGLVHATAVRDAAGRPLHLLAQLELFAHDVRQGASARAEEARASAILDQLPWGVFVHVRGSCVYANGAFHRLRGLAGRSSAGEPITGFVHPDDRARLAEQGRDAARGRGSLAPVLVRLLRQDGAAVEVEASSRAVRFGETDAVLVSVRDLSEDSRAARERELQLRQLAQDRRWLENALERIPVAVLLSSGEGRRAQGNKAAEELLGRPIDPSRGIDQYAAQVCDEDGTPLQPDELPIAIATRGEAVGPCDYVVRRTDGRLVRTRVTAAPVWDENGTVLGGVSVFEDVTRERELLRAREEWITVVSHDLRQPVTVILAYAELLARTSQDPAVAARVRHVMSSARRLERMIADLLDMSRLEAHGLQLRRESLKSAPLLNAVTERLKPSLRGRELQVAISDDLPEIHADPARVEQVLENLLTNAAKYGATGRPIAFRASARDAGLLVEVENEGEGIAPEQVPLLFRRFHRAVPGTSAVQGLGLGLYIAHGLVEAHGGRIWAESERGGKTRFFVWLPAMVVGEAA